MKSNIHCILSIVLLSSFIIGISSIDCETRIIDRGNLLLLDETSALCGIIQQEKNANIILRLVPNIQGIKQKLEDHSYDSDSESLFDQICKQTGKCSQTVLVSVYHSARKIRITTGKDMTKILEPNVKIAIISDMGKSLSMSNYFQALETAVNSIRRRIELFHSRSSEEIPQKKESLSMWTVIFTALLIAVGIAYVFQKDNSSDIHFHVQKLNVLRHQIKSNPPGIKCISDCLVCMSSLLDCNRATLTRFSCGHYFHSKCISFPNRCESCIACRDVTSKVEIDRGIEISHYVTDENCLLVIKNFDRIYTQSDLRRYYSNYYSDIVMLKGLNIVIDWVRNPSIATFSESFKRGSRKGSSFNNSTANVGVGYSNLSHGNSHWTQQKYNNSHSQYFESRNQTKHTSGGDYTAPPTTKHTSGGDYGAPVKHTSGGDYSAPTTTKHTSGGDYDDPTRTIRHTSGGDY